MPVESVKKQIVVDVSQEKAFRTFTDKIDKWWPNTHHIGKVEMKKAVLEQRVGGRWYEVGIDGSECDWGTVQSWDPFNKFVLIWQINSRWQFDSKLITEVEVTFTALDSNKTRVDLEHKNLERFGDDALAVRKNFESEGGWTGLLKAFASETAR